MRAAVFQSCTGIDPAAGAEALVRAIGAARDAGADMLFTPEMSGILDGNRKRAAVHLATEADDRVLAAVREAAAKAGLWVHLGSLALRSGGADERLEVVTPASLGVTTFAVVGLDDAAHRRVAAEIPAGAPGQTSPSRVSRTAAPGNHHRASAQLPHPPPATPLAARGAQLGSSG